MLGCLVSALPANPQTRALSTKVFDGITTPQTSRHLPNFGQSMHIVTVSFPGAALVSGIQVRLEASYDDVLYFPIMPDITQVAPLSGITYTIAVAYAPWPYLRIRSIKPTSTPMTIYYTGNLQPIGPVAPTLQADRVIL